MLKITLPQTKHQKFEIRILFPVTGKLLGILQRFFNQPNKSTFYYQSMDKTEIRKKLEALIQIFNTEKELLVITTQEHPFIDNVFVFRCWIPNRLSKLALTLLKSKEYFFSNLEESNGCLKFYQTQYECSVFQGTIKDQMMGRWLGEHGKCTYSMRKDHFCPFFPFADSSKTFETIKEKD